MAYVKSGTPLSRVSASTKQFTKPPKRIGAAFFAAAIEPRPGRLVGNQIDYAQARVAQPVKRIRGIPASPVKTLKKNLGFGISEWEDPWKSGLISELPTAKRQTSVQQPVAPIAAPRTQQIAQGWQSGLTENWTGGWQSDMMVNWPKQIGKAKRQISTAQPVAPTRSPKVPAIKGIPKSPVSTKLVKV